MPASANITGNRVTDSPNLVPPQTTENIVGWHTILPQPLLWLSHAEVTITAEKVLQTSLFGAVYEAIRESPSTIPPSQVALKSLEKVRNSTWNSFLSTGGAYCISWTRGMYCMAHRGVYKVLMTQTWGLVAEPSVRVAS